VSDKSSNESGRTDDGRQLDGTDSQRPKNTSEIRQWIFDVLPPIKKNPQFPAD
jgi:hypothetical protein